MDKTDEIIELEQIYEIEFDIPFTHIPDTVLRIITIHYGDIAALYIV
jgi:hypothetical protein